MADIFYRKLICKSPSKGSTNILCTSLRVLFSFSLFWCLSLTDGGCSVSPTWLLLPVFCLWNLLTNFLQGLFSALLLIFSKNQSNCNKLSFNRHEMSCLRTPFWKDFLFPWEEMPTLIYFFLSSADCEHCPLACHGTH